MGLTVILEDAAGNSESHAVEDPENHLSRLLPFDDSTSHHLRYIDPYGDTVFNQRQMEPFLAEWKLLLERVESPEQRDLVLRINELARRCQEETHTYLKFYGD